MPQVNQDATGSDAVEYVNETCEKPNRAPQKPESGELMLRVPPEVHAALAAAAQISGKSINEWATEALAKAVHVWFLALVYPPHPSFDTACGRSGLALTTWP